MPKGKDIPIVAMTAAAMQHDREACTLAGMSDHLSKPINSKKMIETLSNCILKYAKDKGKSVTEDTSESASASFEVPGFDFSELTMLLGDDPEQLLQILNMFVEDFSQYDEIVAELLKQGDTEQAHRKVHQLKGTAGNIGAIELHEICEIFDRQLKKGEIDQPTWQRWREVFATTLKNLSSVLQPSLMSTDVAANQEHSSLDSSLKEQLIQLNKLLLADNYISNELIDSVSELAESSEHQPCIQLVEMIRGYRYADARQLLAKLLA
jgi:HPt (histidine-containing phosphotransfer) domain-containing protein